ncbi:hypothetical protein J2X31_002058 [Flavobacterium arsenatis]|uniref:DUF4834 domain-containing protein n=1 Tax=Flavobacterium arsenatis TaxID=1484332 RepID=A0ABU1TQ75_9FLAO|nr:DUF4834 family protein [Flavobacterium arsenatis]MDR6968043.1 hypothetical protein [Flavobacterium arsenatis]
METANLTSFIKTACIIILLYYALKFLARLFLPVLVKKVVQKAEQNFQQQYSHQNQQQNQYQDTNRDEIIIDTAKSTKPRETKKVGEYVDYEEIE